VESAILNIADAWVDRSAHGGRPVIISTAVHPTDHTSALRHLRNEYDEYDVWCMVYGVRCMVYSVWCMWSMEYGVWCMWSMEYGEYGEYGVW
jgi:hypothetical protein